MTAFGDYLRAARLGFRWSQTLQAFLRFGPVYSGSSSVWFTEVAPPGCLPSKAATSEHVRWWDDADPEQVVRLSPVLSGMGWPDGYMSFTLGMDGEVVRK